MKKEPKTESYLSGRWYGFSPGCDDAVSPVIGVMLMLVVTIIVAAVVSGFAGGLVGDNNQQPPSLAMDVEIVNSGNYHASAFSANVLGVSEPIPTKDLKIITSWVTTVKTNTSRGKIWVPRPENPNKKKQVDGEVPGSGCILGLPIGTVYHGGVEVLPGITNSFTYTTGKSVAPHGFGPGVGNLTESGTGSYRADDGPLAPTSTWQFFAVTHFGNYSLEQGTVMMADAAGRPCRGSGAEPGGYPSYRGGCAIGGYGGAANPERVLPNGERLFTFYPYQYSHGNLYNVYTGDKTTAVEIIADGGHADSMQAVLGCGWENLRGGDVVNVKVIHTPSGKTIFNKDVVVKDS